MMPDRAALGPLLEPAHRELRTAVERFAAEALATRAVAEDDAEARAEARELLGLLGAAGWLAIAGAGAPEAAVESAGPAAADLRAACVVREALAAVSPLADAVFALQCLGARPILDAGSPELRARWLPDLTSGRAMAAFAMTEAEAGSDVGAIATLAVRDGDGYRLDGAKRFISNAGLADVYVVFASTDPAAGRRGLSCFVVPATSPGLRFAGAQVLSAPHPLGEIALESCRVPVAARLGEEGEGFEIGLRTLDRLRPTVAAAACGMAARALEEALAHARRRVQFGRRLAEFQMIQQKLARMATELDAARLLSYRAAWAADTGAGSSRITASMAKAFATEAAQRIVDEAVQILGGEGVVMGHPVERLYRAVRALRIYEGTTEIQQLVIARELLRGD